MVAMSGATWFGFAGDSLTFLGGLLLAIDAVDAERRFRRLRQWIKTIEDPEIEGVKLTMRDVLLRSAEDVELAFIRKSAKLALAGAIVLTTGFVALFISRWLADI